MAFLPELGARSVPVAGANVPAVASGTVLAMPDLWQHVAILPGLEVHVHSTASPEVKALAQGVLEQIGLRF